MMESYLVKTEVAKRTIKRWEALSMPEQWCSFESALDKLYATNPVEVDFLKQAIIGIMGIKMFGDKNKIFSSNCVTFAFQALNNIKNDIPLYSLLEIEMFIRKNLISADEQLTLDYYMEKLLHDEEK